MTDTSRSWIFIYDMVSVSYYAWARAFSRRDRCTINLLKKVPEQVDWIKNYIDQADQVIYGP